ncbi:hypothetical protein K4L06_17310 [Lysobacter sp. BMK333-48F3]|uniref:hypothetical protein n=1 Tax=Lysobacter sp. BMK333-48F3 TaxID=2867962 RepID=UPI001C8C324A|nr:hypothetical protein [Lysobacter sp. BMK333-48F3]MBX9403070.1 hypothetical protein [Lysobacter sp. BMK333-48F3]
MERACAEALLRPPSAATASPYALRPGVEQAPEPLPPIAEFGSRDFSRIDSGVHLPAPPKPYQLALSSDLGRRMPRQKPSLQLPDLHRPRVRGLHGNPGPKLSLLQNLPAAFSTFSQLRWSDRHRASRMPDPRMQWIKDLFEGRAKLVPGIGKALQHMTLERDLPTDPFGTFEDPGFREVEVGGHKLQEDPNDSGQFDIDILRPELKFPIGRFGDLRPRGGPSRPDGPLQHGDPSGGRDGTP